MTDNGKLCSANKLYGAVRELRAQLAEKDKELKDSQDRVGELEEYSRHLPSCNMGRRGTSSYCVDLGCTCGFDKIKSLLDRGE